MIYLALIVTSSGVVFAQVQSTEDLVRQGEFFMRSGKFAEALTYFDKALNIAPDYRIWIDKGNAHVQLGQYDQAGKAYEEALSIEPNSILALKGKGTSLELSGNKEGALEYYNKAISALFNQTITSVNTELYNQGIEISDKILSIKPNDVNTTNLKGIFLFYLGRNNEAIQYYDQALQFSPDDVDILFNKALSLLYLERYSDVIKYYDKILQLNPADTHILHSKAFTLGHYLKKYDEAIKYYDEVLKVEPDNPYVLNNKGTALMNLGKSTEGLALIERGMDLEPDFVTKIPQFAPECNCLQIDK